MAQNLRVHIAAVDFETTNRVTDPLINFKADKVYLVTHFKDSPKATANLDKIRKTIARSIPACSVEVVLVDIWDLFSCLTEYRRIFRKESDNHLYVNVSTGSKIVVIAGMLACMIWSGNPYYAKLGYSQQELDRVVQTDRLPVYRINAPSAELLQVAAILRKNGGTMSKKQLIIALQGKESNMIPIYGKDSSKSAPHSKLRALLEPLETEWNFVEVRARGRHSEVKLTSQGESALRIFGDPMRQATTPSEAPGDRAGPNAEA